MKNFLSVFVSPHFVSFYKRTVLMALTAFVAFLISNIAKFNIPVYLTGIVGLGLGQLEAYLNEQEKVVPAE